LNYKRPAAAVVKPFVQKVLNIETDLPID